MSKFNKFYSQSKEYILVVSLLIVSLTILSLNEKSEVKKIRTLAFGSFSVFNSFINSFTGLFQKDSEIAELKKLNAELMLKLNMMREYGLENSELKKLVNVKDTSDFPLHPTAIISKLVSITQGNYIINSGKKDSIETGMAVISEKGLVGITTDVSENYSVVRNIFNSNLNLAVRVQRSGVDGILSWNGTNLVIKNVPTTHDVKIGDRIVISEFSTIVPPSIPIGLATKKETTVSGLLSNITVTPFADFNKIKNVFVVKIVPSKQMKDLELNLFKKN